MRGSELAIVSLLYLFIASSSVNEAWVRKPSAWAVAKLSATDLAKTYVTFLSLPWGIYGGYIQKTLGIPQFP